MGHCLEYISYDPEQQKVTVENEEGVFEADIHLEDDPHWIVEGDYFTPPSTISGRSIQEKAEDLWRLNRELFIEIL